MGKLIAKVSSAMVVLAAMLPMPASSEVPGSTHCANPSWNALVSGDCGIGDVLVERQRHQVEPESSLALVDLPTDSIPEPETYALMLVGLVAVVFAARRKRGRRD